MNGHLTDDVLVTQMENLRYIANFRLFQVGNTLGVPMATFFTISSPLSHGELPITSEELGEVASQPVCALVVGCCG